MLHTRSPFIDHVGDWKRIWLKILHVLKQMMFSGHPNFVPRLSRGVVSIKNELGDRQRGNIDINLIINILMTKFFLKKQELTIIVATMFYSMMEMGQTQLSQIVHQPLYNSYIPRTFKITLYLFLESLFSPCMPRGARLTSFLCVLVLYMTNKFGSQ